MPELLYPIETERLRLRPIEPDDAAAIFAYHSLPEVAEFQFWEPRTSEDIAALVVEWAGQSAIETEGAIVLAAVQKENGVLIGDVVLRVTDAPARQGTFGYTFHPASQGNGFATEAARKLLQLGFETFGLHRMFARCDARNTASWRVMERLGMRREAHFREHALFKGGWDEEFYYAMLEDEWRQSA